MSTCRTSTSNSLANVNKKSLMLRGRRSSRRKKAATGNCGKKNCANAMMTRKNSELRSSSSTVLRKRWSLNAHFSKTNVVRRRNTFKRCYARMKPTN